MADQGKPNRIEVDLQLLADKDLQEMDRIFTLFGDSVGKMTSALDGFEKQIQSAMGAVTGGTGSGVGTSTGGPQTAGHPGPALAGNPIDVIERRRDDMRKSGIWGAQNILASHAITAQEREAFTAPRFGNYTFQDVLRLVSHETGNRSFQFNPNPGTDAQGNPLPEVTQRPGRAGLARIAAATGTAAYYMPHIHTVNMLRNRAARALTIPRAIAQRGTQLGYSPSNGILGTPIGSSAFMNTISQQWDAAKQSWFGFDPNYSSGEASAARQAITGFGYTGAVGDAYATQLKNIYEKTGMSGSETMPMMDKATRFGGASIQQFSAAMQQVPGAAQAARMGLQQFIADLDTTATSLAQSTNMSYATAFQTAKGMSSSTGLAPQEAVKPITNDLYTMMRVARSGGNWYGATMGSFQGSQTLGQVSGMIQNITGFSLDQMKGLKTRNPAAFQAAMNKLIPIARFNPQILGGYSIKDIINMGEHGNAIGRQTGRDAISLGMMTNHNGGRTSVTAIGHDIGWTANQMAAFQAQHAGDTYKQKLNAITDAMNKGDARMGKDARQRITLDLTPAAKQLVQVQDTNTKRSNYAAGIGPFPTSGGK